MNEEQISFANVPFERFAKTTRRAQLLEEMNRILPWKDLCAVVQPYYPAGEAGRVPIPLERMLRIHLLQQWFNLSDPAAEEALYDIISTRTFAGIDLGRARVPDETTICKSRHLLEKPQAWRSHLQNHQRVPSQEWREGFDRDDRRCDNHLGSQFDQEYGRRARPRDASDQEGQPVAFWHGVSRRSRHVK
jgi:hypothetical protein